MSNSESNPWQKTFAMHYESTARSVFHTRLHNQPKPFIYPRGQIDGVDKLIARPAGTFCDKSERREATDTNQIAATATSTSAMSSAGLFSLYIFRSVAPLGLPSQCPFFGSTCLFCLHALLSMRRGEKTLPIKRTDDDGAEDWDAAGKRMTKMRRWIKSRWRKGDYGAKPLVLQLTPTLTNPLVRKIAFPRREQVSTPWYLIFLYHIPQSL